ncbi:MAG: SDR family oxidoreductase [Gemmatimonadetes bacterium]|nr:SDR family oxidoreductase [Gemmatimonadota bacterium]NIQ53416.1 SDR family oxidoreductase [Gemmatimonadota bacterium]NIU73562.1 SDR family oxidoreductase [Gammaproteobacteria bacterium]NIX43760.1 SDR family oxidoreductase [Gemmatimonadota bacterium]NIY07956.1 SDR family oxidoreductase [Gemmatimonadota bacterium]
MDLQLEDLKAIVTGGSAGIGRSTATVLAEEGCHVGICARGEEGVRDAVAALEGNGRTAFGRAVDVADRDALEGWVEDSAAALGGLDIVVANVSSLGSGEGYEEWRRAFEVDLLHTVAVVDAALPYLRASDAAAIVIVSSVAAREPIDAGAYGAIKAALNRHGKGLAGRLAPEGIRVNVVSPGTIYMEDGFWGAVERKNPDMFRQALDANPMGRMGRPEEVARSIAFLASPAASFIAGTNLLVDGALTRGVQM